MNEILKINNVTKYYGSGSVVTKALDGISFTVEKGEFTAIMGASGSGKSTLLLSGDSAYQYEFSVYNRSNMPWSPWY